MHVRRACPPARRSVGPWRRSSVVLIASLATAAAGGQLAISPAQAGAAAIASTGSAMLTGTKAAKVVGEQVNEIAIPTVSGPALRTGSGARVAASLTAARTASFRLVAVTWDHGSAARGTRIEVRTGRSGRWTAWQHLDAVPSEGPAAREDSSVRDGTEPLWVDQADGVDVRVIVPAAAKAPAGLEVAAIDPGVSSTDHAIATDPQSLAAGEVPARSPAARAAGHGAKITPMPRIISRVTMLRKMS